MKVVLLPGIPPVRYFYDRWASEIGEETTVLYPQPIHPAEQPSSWFEAETERYRTAALKTPGPLIIIAHSFGAVFAMELLRSAPDRIQTCVLVTPVFEVHRLMGAGFFALARFFEKFEPVKNFLIEHRDHLLDPLFPNAVFLSDDEINQLPGQGCLGLRYLRVHSDSQLNLPEEIREKVSIWYGDRDRWDTCSQSGVWGEIGNSYQLSYLNHRFLVDPELRKRLTAEILPTLNSGG